MKWRQFNPRFYAKNSVDSVTSPVEIKILNATHEIKVENLKTPVLMEIRTEKALPTPKVVAGQLGVNCAFFDESQKKWSVAGCVFAGPFEKNVLRCKCRHFTSFVPQIN